MKKVTAIATAAAMILSLFAGTKAEAAAKPALSEKKMNLTVGAEKTLKIKKAKKAAAWSIIAGKGKVVLKNKKKASVKIVAKKAGKAKVQAKVGKKKLVCTVTVKEKKKETQKETPAPIAPSGTPAQIQPVVTPPAPTPDSTESPDEQALKAFIAEQKAKGPTTISGNIHDPKEYKWDPSGKKLIGICWDDREHADDKGLRGELSFSAFSDLEELTVHYNTEVTRIDVTGNPKLKSLTVVDTGIEDTLDVSKNTELEVLECYFNYLSSLDVTHNPKLRVLNCGSNSIDELDLSQNPELEDLDCYSNSLEELDWTHNVKLTSLSCGNNSIREVDVSMLPDLEYLDCVALKSMETLDVSANHKLKTVGCEACDMLTTLILNPEIENIWIGSTPIKVIDASRCLKTPTVHAGEGQEYTLIPPTA